MDIFLKGLVIGLAICVPMGAVSLLGIHRTIAHSKYSGLMTGLGAIIADAIFGVISAFGLTVIANLINSHKEGLSIFGAILLFYVAIDIFFSKSKDRFIAELNLPPIINEVGELISGKKNTLRNDFVSGFLLTITNPLTLVALLALLAWFGIDSGSSSIGAAISVVLGLVAGAVIWWTGLLTTVSFLKTKIKIPSFKILNKIFGVILFILAILIFIRVL